MTGVAVGLGSALVLGVVVWTHHPAVDGPFGGRVGVAAMASTCSGPIGQLAQALGGKAGAECRQVDGTMEMAHGLEALGLLSILGGVGWGLRRRPIKGGEVDASGG